MSTITEIKDAIRALAQEEREKLADDLPTILPELNGDREWKRIIDNPRPNKTLSALGDEIDAQMGKNPDAYPVMAEKNFERRS